MLKQGITFLLVTFFGISVASADQKPQSLPADSRIKQFVYDENTVYRLDLYLKSITSVQFSRGEEVKSLLIGDSASWEVIRLKSGNVISIKPKIPNAFSNLTVYTNRRVYTFELKTVGTARARHSASRNQSYRISFAYPSTSQVQEFNGGVGSNINNNFNYFVSGEARFEPYEVFDNGKQTFFAIPDNAPRPTVFRANSRGKETLVNVRSNGDFLIADSVSDLWTLRIGDEALCVSQGSARAKTNLISFREDITKTNNNLVYSVSAR